MNFFHPETLKSAVQVDILEETRASCLSGHIQAEFGFRSLLLRDDEPFEFFRGFSEIFVTLGLGLLWGGTLGLIGLYVSWVFAHLCGLMLCLCLQSLWKYFSIFALGHQWRMPH